MRTSRRLAAFGVAVTVLAVGPGPVAARDSVDPSTLNPPPPDFLAVCAVSGEQTICTLAFSDPDFVDEASGIVCDGVELLVSQSRSVVGKRYYDSDGNLTQLHFRESFSGTYTNPETGLVADWVQHDTVIHNLSVPGDASSGTTHVTGFSGG